MASLTCGMCGNVVQAGVLICPVCGAFLPVASAAPAAPPTATAPAPGVEASAAKGAPTATCPRSWCGQEYPVGATVCPSCFEPVPAGRQSRRAVSAVRISLPTGGTIGARPGATVQLGRESSDARIADSLDRYDAVSRRHAEVVVGTESVAVSDVGSRNGTCVDGVPARGPVVLDEGRHEVRLGQSVALELEILTEDSS